MYMKDLVPGFSDLNTVLQEWENIHEHIGVTVHSDCKTDIIKRSIYQLNFHSTGNKECKSK